MPTPALAALFILGTILFALVTYAVARKIAGDAHSEKTEALATSVIRLVSALHGLILALVFAQELHGYVQLQASLVREATAVADIYHDIKRYETEQHETVQTALSDYVRVVIDEEWQQLAENRKLSSKGWALREVVYQAVLDLTPETPRQEALRDHMLNKVQLIAEMRQQRENNALHTMSPLFWIAALAGIALIALPNLVFAPTRLHLVLLCVYGGFSGLVMFIIYALSDPFAAPATLQPAAFERLLETEIGTGT